MTATVMLIDDSDADLLYSRIMIERAGIDAEVITFESARDALAHLQRPGAPAVALILLDINMPGMNGFEFLAAYEQLPAGLREQAVVVMLTSSPDPADKARALAHACVRGYVTKPIDVAGAASMMRYLSGSER